MVSGELGFLGFHWHSEPAAHTELPHCRAIETVDETEAAEREADTGGGRTTVFCLELQDPVGVPGLPHH